MSGILFIIAAASGTGKTTLVRAVLQTEETIKLSISYTTRPPRPQDKEGIDYYFVDEAKFQQMVKENEFLEHAKVFGHYYGTSRAVVEKALESNQDVLLEIDWQGAAQVRKQFSNVVSIFILPPSKEALRERLLIRKQDSAEVLENRLQIASSEIAQYPDYDYIVLNDNFDEAREALQSIIVAERCRRDRQAKKLQPLLKELIETT